MDKHKIYTHLCGCEKHDIIRTDKHNQELFDPETDKSWTRMCPQHSKEHRIHQQILRIEKTLYDIKWAKYILEQNTPKLLREQREYLETLKGIPLENVHPAVVERPPVSW